MRKWFGRLVAGVSLAGMLLSGSVAWLGRTLPDTYRVPEGEPLRFAQFGWLAPLAPGGIRAAQNPGGDASGNVTLSLWGIVPIKTVRAVGTKRRTVAVSGKPFGIKMFSDGALIVGFSDVRTGLGLENPAKEAGLRMGDLVVSIDGKNVRTNDQVAKAIQAAGERSVRVIYLRGGVRATAWVTPVRAFGGDRWQVGMWVRDSSAGLGTLTFVDPDRHLFAGLGHAISDSDTGENITLLSGEIVGVDITDAVRGAAGVPGELRGQFGAEDPLGSVCANCTEGVFGSYTQEAGEMIPVAFAQEVTTGPAQILSTTKGTTPRLYSVNIEHLSLNSGDPNRNMVLHVTDPALLAATGGIVQGMSGSPILQNGSLVGAVTHVLVNDPTRGYGIFAQRMLDRADELEAGEGAA